MNFHLSLYYNRVLKSTQQKYLKIDKKISLFQGFEGIFSFYKCQTPEFANIFAGSNANIGIHRIHTLHFPFRN